jgi:hypothetical protein
MSAVSHFASCGATWYWSSWTATVLKLVKVRDLRALSWVEALLVEKVETWGVGRSWEQGWVDILGCLGGAVRRGGRTSQMEGKGGA